MLDPKTIEEALLSVERFARSLEGTNIYHPLRNVLAAAKEAQEHATGAAGFEAVAKVAQCCPLCESPIVSISAHERDEVDAAGLRRHYVVPLFTCCNGCTDESGGSPLQWHWGEFERAEEIAIERERDNDKLSAELAEARKGTQQAYEAALDARACLMWMRDGDDEELAGDAKRAIASLDAWIEKTPQWQEHERRVGDPAKARLAAMRAEGSDV